MYMFAHVINLTIYLLPPPHPEAKPRGILLIKRQLKLKHFKSLIDLIDCVCEKVKNELTMVEIISITRYGYYSNLFG